MRTVVRAACTQQEAHKAHWKHPTFPCSSFRKKLSDPGYQGTLWRCSPVCFKWACGWGWVCSMNGVIVSFSSLSHLPTCHWVPVLPYVTVLQHFLGTYRQMHTLCSLSPLPPSLSTLCTRDCQLVLELSPHKLSFSLELHYPTVRMCMH